MTAQGWLDYTENRIGSPSSGAPRTGLGIILREPCAVIISLFVIICQTDNPWASVHPNDRRHTGNKNLIRLKFLESQIA